MREKRAVMTDENGGFFLVKRCLTDTCLRFRIASNSFCLSDGFSSTRSTPGGSLQPVHIGLFPPGETTGSGACWNM